MAHWLHQPGAGKLMSYLIRQKIVVAIDNEPLVSGKDVSRFLIYLPEGEKQELSMLFMHYLLKSRGNHVAYIGQDITLADLKDACTIYQPDYIFTMITETFSKEPLQQYVDRLSENFQDCTILLSGYQVVAQKVEQSDNVEILKSLDQTMEFLQVLDLQPKKLNVSK